MSIMPFESDAPTNMPIAAIAIIVLNDAAFEPMAELRKFTASLLTPTERSNTASTKMKMTRNR